MSGPKKKKTPAEELIESLLRDVGEDVPSSDDQAEVQEASIGLEGFVMSDEAEGKGFTMAGDEYDDATKTEFESTRNLNEGSFNDLKFTVDDEKDSLNAAMGSLQAQATAEQQNPAQPEVTIESENLVVLEVKD
ncbi:MAG: hypothetical protein ABL930_10185, partial [Pseudobdellovibrio sp.]